MKFFPKITGRTKSLLANFSSKLKKGFSSVASKIRDRWSLLSKEDRAGLYVTVIFHLAVIIVLLIVQIGYMTFGEKGILMDFSTEEKKEKEVREKEFKEDISRKVDEMIRAAVQESQIEVRNIAVDASERLKDDRGTNADELYRDAERLRNDLKSNAFKEDAREETVDLDITRKGGDEKEYSGPSVVSYTLDGRKASSLKVPAYRCMGGGEVTVVITVDPKGNVIGAKVMESVSSTDRCLQEFAVRAARLSRFSALPQDRLMADKSLARQTGEIVYKFVAQ